MNNNKCYTIIIIALLLLTFSISSYCANHSGIDKRPAIYIEDLDSSFVNHSYTPSILKSKLLEKQKQFAKSKDTVGQIIILIELSDLERWNGEFEKGFDLLWKAYELSKATNDNALQIRIHRNLGISYTIFNQDSLALKYFTLALKQAKALKQYPLIIADELRHTYYSMANLYTVNRAYDLAIQYMDSCKLCCPHMDSFPHVEAELGRIYGLQGKLKIAKEKLLKALEHFGEENTRYLVKVYANLGNIEYKEGNNDKALYYLQKSLDKIEEFKSFTEIKPEIHEKMAKIFREKKDYELAYQYLLYSKVYSDSLFSATNNRNKQLFQIKNIYEQNLEKSQAQIEEQDVIINQKNQQLMSLIVFSISIIILSIGLFIIYKNKNRIKKLELQQVHEKEKSEAVLRTKNKELTSYALKMMEKELAIKELLNSVKEKSPSEYPLLRNKHTNSSDKLWEDFNRRFLELNQQFYQKLRKQHPDLTSTELKHCALMKLNFDNKEMSQILNISLQSVHTSKYRIRKKMNLDQEVNLNNYISSI